MFGQRGLQQLAAEHQARVASWPEEHALSLQPAPVTLQWKEETITHVMLFSKNHEVMKFIATKLNVIPYHIKLLLSPAAAVRFALCAAEVARLACL